MLSRHLLRAALAAIPVSLLALAAPPTSAAVARPAALGGAGFGRSAAPQLVRDLRAAWQISKGAGVTVAVLAGGVDPTAPGLTGDVTTGPAFGNVAGDTNAGGTVFASGVAGRGPSGSNPAGTLGLAPAARILAERVPNHGRNGPFQRAYAAAIRYAAGHGAQVIWVAGEAYQDAAVLDRAVEYAESKNAVVISTEYAGQHVARNASTVPGSLPGVLGAATVLLPGMTAPSKFIASPANESILVAAPGDVLTVTGPLGQGYQMFNNLASAAWLTATVALIKSVYPHLPASLVDLAIARSARDHPNGGYSKQVGFGLLNPDGALHQAAALAKLPATAPTGAESLAGSAHLGNGSGPPPGVIAAVHHSTSQEAGFAGAMVAGLVLLVVAAVLALRWRKSSGSRRKRANPTGA
jgi:subtilase family protein